MPQPRIDIDATFDIAIDVPGYKREFHGGNLSLHLKSKPRWLHPKLYLAPLWAAFKLFNIRGTFDGKEIDAR